MLQGVARYLITLNSDMETALGMEPHYTQGVEPPESAMSWNEQVTLAYFMSDLLEFTANPPAIRPPWVTVNERWAAMMEEHDGGEAMDFSGFTYYVFTYNHNLVTMICS